MSLRLPAFIGGRSSAAPAGIIDRGGWAWSTSETGPVASRVFEGQVRVQWGRLNLSDPGIDLVDLVEAFAGQVNGLCGAATVGALCLKTGLHTGKVHFTVDVLKTAPLQPLPGEDVVEVSYSATEPAAAICEWAGDNEYPFRLPSAGTYRVRYSARSMDAGRRMSTGNGNAAGPDRYGLQFWRSPHQADAIIQLASAEATYLHNCAYRARTQVGRAH